MTEDKITRIDDHRPHCAGNIICVHCLHEWTAVWPEKTNNLECPNCGDMTPTDPDAKYKALYHDLIMEVRSKWPNETRHETARRYIREYETPCAGCRGDSDEHTCHLQCASANIDGESDEPT